VSELIITYRGNHINVEREGKRFHYTARVNRNEKGTYLGGWGRTPVRTVTSTVCDMGSRNWKRAIRKLEVWIDYELEHWELRITLDNLMKRVNLATTAVICDMFADHGVSEVYDEMSLDDLRWGIEQVGLFANPAATTEE